MRSECGPLSGQRIDRARSVIHHVGVDQPQNLGDVRFLLLMHRLATT